MTIYNVFVTVKRKGSHHSCLTYAADHLFIKSITTLQMGLWGHNLSEGLVGSYVV